MKFFNRIKEFITKFDFFSETGLLRYRQKSQYSTFFGGFCSLTIILLVLIIFYGKIKDTFNKVVINYWIQDQSSNHPTPYNLSYSSDFMFAVEIHRLNISNQNQPRYFDVVFEYYTAKDANFNDDDSIFYHLQSCTQKHWNRHHDVLHEAKLNAYENMLCMPLNQSLEIKGKLSSPIFNYIILAINKCTNSSFYSQPCASQQQIDAFFKAQGDILYYSLYFVNPVINPNDKQFIKYTLQDRHHIPFTKTYGVNNYIFLQQFEIRTDNSITPMNDFSSIKGVRQSQENSRKDFFLRNSGENEKRYSSYRFYKSSQGKTYHRSFIKIDQTLSYLGGLIQTITILLIIIKVYATYSFEMDIAANLFNSQRKGTNKPLRQYNFLKFLSHFFYKVLSFVGLKPNWKASKEYMESKQEILKQLDVRFLFKRIMFLEKALQVLLTPQEKKALNLQSRMTFTQAKKMRKNYKERIKYLKLWEKILLNEQFTNNPSKNTALDNKIQSTRQLIENGNTLKIFDNVNFQKQPNNNENFIENIKTKARQRIEEQYLSSDDSELQEKDQQMNLEKEKEKFSQNLLRLQTEIFDKEDQKRVEMWNNIDPDIKKMFFFLVKRYKMQDIEQQKSSSDAEQVNGLQIRLNQGYGSVSKSLHVEQNKNAYQLSFHNKTNRL